MDLNTSSFLFEQLGGETTLDNRNSTPATSAVGFIDSNVRLVGVKTGCMIDIPVRYVRLV
jgi:hypothetical protein